MMKRILLTLFVFGMLTHVSYSQLEIKGLVTDAELKDPIIGATVIIAGTTSGTTTDWDGTFTLSVESLPVDIEVSYIGYENKMVSVVDDQRVNVSLSENAVVIEGVEVKASRISEKQKESPLTIEALDIIAIKETPSADFYDGLGALKGVDLTAASLGFKVINTRGFNSTSPVRSLQIIDGVDNQAPGLNFSLGNFLGSSELDINKVEIVVGASSAFYGPNAFNGVISMETKDPFFHDGLSATIRVAERNMLKGAIRWADKFQNKDGKDRFAYKLNLEMLRADDWVADNYDPVDGSDVESSNPGRYDAVNVYGDEYQSGNDFTSIALSDLNVGLRSWYRTGYKEEDLVDYNTKNFKANAALHYRLKPNLAEQSPELILSGNFGSGTTVYQGDNRFSLRGITFLQNRLELRKANKYFLRAYTTRTGAGDSYDPYFTAQELQRAAKSNSEWSVDYTKYWTDNIAFQMQDLGYPQLSVIFDPETGVLITDFDVDGANQWLVDNNNLLTQWHSEAEAFANEGAHGGSFAVPFFEPGTERFNQEFERITSTLRDPNSDEGGTKFFDNSSLYHVHGEYIFTPSWTNKITVGSNARLYNPISKGTVFSDTSGVKITNFEFGVYGGIEKSFADNKLKATATLRMDKNQNFDLLFSPAASLVYTPSENNFLRVSFSSAIRNPTLTDQFLQLDVGPATLSGNINGVDGLLSIDNLRKYFANPNPAILDSTFSIAPIRPENVKSFELGYRTTLFEKLYTDVSYYYSIYDNFIGYQIGADFEPDATGNGISKLDIFRFSANSTEQVITQGASIGLNYYVAKNYSLNGNYSWNNLLKTNEDDPIIPAFNTPEHKFNLGFSGRNLSMNVGSNKIRNIGFNVNYKWIEGFLFEGSPQFTGFIPTYDMLDAQVNVLFSKYDTTVKVGASNVLNNQSFQTYGGPRIGRLAYIALTYQPQ